MDYYQPARDQYIHKQMYPKEYRQDFFPPKGQQPADGALKIGPKPPCAPKFVAKIEGNAVEEGAKVFFEGIVDAQPQPIFVWYFEDEEIHPGSAAWEEAEIHHSRKMSTLIVKYAREHHMGKYSLVAQNKLGHAVTNCDLIVRKKQFPPVFWQRLYNYESAAGTRLVAEVEVGGWPLPEVFWYKEDELVVSKMHTENYNGYPNKYVPERRIEVRQIDQIRYCLVFHRVSEADSGMYTVRAVNPLGEAICEAEFFIEPGEGGSADTMYLPDLWRNGNRMTWKMEDEMRKKPFVGMNEPELTDADIKEMTKRVASTPLPKAMEYFANLPDYLPADTSKWGLLDMPYNGDSALRSANVKPRTGQRGGQPSFPSKFVAGKITHRGYSLDSSGRILPIWVNPLDQFAIDPNTLNFVSVHPDYPHAGARPDRAKSPDAPPVWESQATIDALIQLLKTIGRRLEVQDIRSDKLGNANQAKKQDPINKANYKVEHQNARKQVMNNVKSEPKRNTSAPNTPSAVRKVWEDRLNSDQAGVQENAQDFTKQFVNIMYTGSAEGESSSTVTTSKSSSSKQVVFSDQLQQQQSVDSAPALPPKTKIMFSPSRSVFSPPTTSDAEEPEESGDGKDFIPVKEKAKMITQQQEQIVRREESSRQEGRMTGEALKGGVRILPPSPVTVRKEMSHAVSAASESMEGYEVDERYQYSQQMKSSSSSSSMVVTSSSISQQQQQQPNYIPVLEDKYCVEENLEELVSQEELEHQKQLQFQKQERREQEELYRQQQAGQERLRQQEEQERMAQEQELLHQQQLLQQQQERMRQEQLQREQEEFRQQQILQQQQEQLRLREEELHRQQEQLIMENSSVIFQQSNTTVQSSSSRMVVESSSGLAEKQVTPPEVMREKCRRSFEEAELEAAMTAASAKGATEYGDYSQNSFPAPPPPESSFQGRQSLFGGSVSQPATPSMSRKVRSRHPSQAGRAAEDDKVKYRSPPREPFQPAFYRTPINDDRDEKMFRLPGKKINTSTEVKFVGRAEEDYDGDTEF